MADCSEAELAHCQAQLSALFERQGIASADLEWQLRVQAVMPQFDRKRRRIIRQVAE